MKRHLTDSIALFVLLPALLAAQTPSVQPQDASPAAQTPTAQKEAKLPRTADRRRATKLYLKASKLFLAQRYEEAMALYGEAAHLDPTSTEYRLAVGVARSHAVLALVQSAAQLRLRGDAQGARQELSRALALDPENPLVGQHLNELSGDALLVHPVTGQTPLQLPVEPGSAATLAPTATPRSFHLHTGARQVIQMVFRGYGVEATVDDSVRAGQIHFDIDNASFSEAISALLLLTHSFYVPLDQHRALVARDTRELRQQYTRLELETLSLSGLNANELTELANLAKNTFGAQTAAANASTGTLTVRATPLSLDAFNRTLHELVAGRSQIILDVSVIQLAHSHERTSGVSTPQTISAFNVYAEEQSILSSNSTLVEEIVSSGLASADDPLAIIAILLEAGEVSSSLLSGGIAIFGGGITENGLSFGSASISLGVNTSQSRQLDHAQLRVGDGDDQGATLRLGSRYPIQTSSYSSLGTSSTVSGLTTSGTSSALASLLASATSSSTSTIPMIQYEDLGFTLKLKAAVMRNNRVALDLGLKIDALSGSTLNDNPILNSRSYEGDVQVEEGAAIAIVSELDRSETRSISGTPGLDEIPGLSLTDSHDKQRSDSTLLVVVTPHIVRSPQPAGHSSILHIDRSSM